MTKLVLIHRSDTHYEDEPDRVYDFPRAYLAAVEAGRGDWAVYYEPVKAGGRGFFAVARIAGLRPKPGAEGRFLADIEPATYLDFPRPVPRLRPDGRPWEGALADPDGRPQAGGLQQSAVRRLPEADFAAIVAAGLAEEAAAAPGAEDAAGLAEAAAPFARPVAERLTGRPVRDAAFRARVLSAYGFRCAVSGLGLRNGGGAPEVQAAHIRPVAHQGSDSVRNGLALSATLHWMFDRGLIAVAEDHAILVSRNKVPRDVADRLIRPEGRLLLPEARQDWPHPGNLRWHRENVFGQTQAAGPLPWG